MIKRLFGKSDFLKNSAILIIGTGLAQIIPVAMQPLLRRMFDPSDFGVFEVYFSMSSIFAVSACLRYDQAIVMPEKDEDGQQLLYGSMMISLLISTLAFFVFFFFGEQIALWRGWPKEVIPWLAVLPASIFMLSGHQAFMTWLNRKKKYKALGLNKLIRRSGEAGAQYATGKYGLGYGLIGGTLIGDGINFLVYLFQFKRSTAKIYKPSMIKIRAQFRRYSELPRYGLVPNLFNTVALFLPGLILAEKYGSDIAGHYNLSKQILALPIALVALAVSQVLAQKIVELRHNGKKVLPLIRQLTIGLSILAGIGIITMVFAGDVIFTFAFGENWGLATWMSQILVFTYAVKFIVSPLTISFVVLERIKISSIWQVGYFILILSFYLMDFLSLEKFIIVYTLVDVGAYLIYFILLYTTCAKVDNTIVNE